MASVSAWVVRTGSSQPLGAALEAVDARLQDVKEDVLDTIRGHFNQFSRAFTCVNDLRSKVDDVGRQLHAAAAEAAGKDPASATMSATESAAREHRLSQHVEACELVLNTLRTLAELHQLFVQFDEHLESGRYAEAADGLTAAQALMDGLPSGDAAADSRVVTAVRNQFRKQRSRFRARMCDLFARAVAVEGREVRVVHELPGVFQHLHYSKMTTTTVLLQCFEKADIAQDRFDDLATRLRRHVLNPILSGAFTPEETVSSKQATLRCVADDADGAGSDTDHDSAAGGAGAGAGVSAGSMTAASAAGPSAGGGGGGSAAAVAVTVESVTAIIQHVARVFEFLSEHVFESKPELSQLLGSRLWWGLTHQSDRVLTSDVGSFVAVADKPNSGVVHVLVKRMQSALPAVFADLPSYGTVLAAAKDLEDQLFTSTMLVPSPDTPGAVLSSFADHLDTHFAYKKRQDVLATARQLCGVEYFNSKRIADDTDPLLAADSSLPQPEWHVSDNAINLVELAHNTFREACEVPPSCAAVLYETARDTVDVFRALVPAMFGSSITAVPRLAMLFHNDCLYIAHRLITMAHLYRHKLPPPLNRTASMADLVPAFRTTAETTFMAQLQRQRRDLLALAPSVSLEDLGRDDVFEVAETAVKAQMYKLDQLSSQWVPVLQRPVYFAAMGQLLGVVLSSMMSTIKQLPRVSVPVAHQLHYLFSLMFEGEKFFSSTPTTPSPGPSGFVDCWERTKRLADALGRDQVNNTVVNMLLA